MNHALTKTKKGINKELFNIGGSITKLLNQFDDNYWGNLWKLSKNLQEHYISKMNHGHGNLLDSIRMKLRGSRFISHQSLSS